MSRRTIVRAVAISVAAVGVGIQFIPVADIGTNPPNRFRIDVSPQASAILRRACYD